MLAGGGTVVIFLSVVGGVVGWFSRTSSSALEELTEPEVTIFEILMSQYLLFEAKHLSIHPFEARLNFKNVVILYRHSIISELTTRKD